jgi:sarcosine oxidase
VSGHFDVIVVGAGGAMGAATCFELARRKRRVLGLDRFGIAHDRGSSHGHTRMIRLAYYEHLDYVPLLRRAYERWRALEDVSGQRLLTITGGLYAGPPAGELVARSHEAAVRHGIEHELLDRDEIARRYPQLQLPAGFAALYEPSTGFLRPERVIAAYARHALVAGAEIHGHEPLRSWSSRTAQGPIAVRTTERTYTCDRIVFCGGVWTPALLPGLGVELRVTRQVVGWVWPARPADFAPDRLPTWAVQSGHGSLYYGFPMSADDAGLKIGHHKPGLPADPDRLSRDPLPADARSIERIVKKVLPAARGPIVSMSVCMYTNSPDGHFVVGNHGGDDRVWVACGFSGHGFKFASVMGEILADLATTGATQWPIGFLSPARFRNDRG